MDTTRQKRVSCEACRARKLKCSGKQSGCSRCVHLGLLCEFRDRGMPGRPRKWSTAELSKPRAQQSQHKEVPPCEDRQRHQNISHPPALEAVDSTETPSTVFTDESSTGASVSVDHFSVLSQDWSPSQDYVSVAGDDQPHILSLLDFNTSENFHSLSLDPFSTCLTNNVHPISQAEESPTTALMTSSGSLKSCDCSKQVFETLRVLQRGSVSHSTVNLLREATNLLDKLLICPVCYDVSKPPRITLQNVLLLGRLFLEITTTYHEYLKWVKSYCCAVADTETGSMVYLPINSDATSSMLGFELDGGKLYDIITHGLRIDVKRLSHLGTRFAVRQHNRHLIGHESCPDTQGRCWKETADVDPDPSDVCPQSSAARALTPCYRIVDEVNSHVKQFKDALV